MMPTRTSLSMLPNAEVQRQAEPVRCNALLGEDSRK